MLDRKPKARFSSTLSDQKFLNEIFHLENPTQIEVFAGKTYLYDYEFYNKESRYKIKKIVLHKNASNSYYRKICPYVT